MDITAQFLLDELLLRNGSYEAVRDHITATDPSGEDEALNAVIALLNSGTYFNRYEGVEEAAAE